MKIIHYSNCWFHVWLCNKFLVPGRKHLIHRTGHPKDFSRGDRCCWRSCQSKDTRCHSRCDYWIWCSRSQVTGGILSAIYSFLDIKCWLYDTVMCMLHNILWAPLWKLKDLWFIFLYRIPATTLQFMHLINK